MNFLSSDKALADALADQAAAQKAAASLELMLLLFTAALAGEVHDQAIEHAEGYLGTPWAWNGQATAANPGLGCMSFVFRSYSAATGTPRASYSVNPSELVASGLLGPQTAVISRGEEVPFERGDVVFFLLAGYEIPDAPLHIDGDTKYWPWHMGLYTGEGQVLHSEPGGEVRYQALEDISWDRVLATRP